MLLTEFQKEIVNQIIKGKIHNFADFIKANNIKHELKDIEDSQHDILPEYIITDPEKDKDLFFEYYLIIKKLEEYKIISIVHNPRTWIFYHFINSKGQKENLSDIRFSFLSQIIYNDIHSLPELQLFKKRKYKTEEEYKLSASNKATVLFQIITIIIALLSITLSLFAFLKPVDVQLRNIDQFNNFKYHQFKDEDEKILNEIIYERKMINKEPLN